MPRSLFDEQDLVEVRSDLYPGERLMGCRHPLMAERRGRQREARLEATEKRLEPIVAATRREKRRLKGTDRIGARVGQGIGRYRMAKHFEWTLDEDGCFDDGRDAGSIAAEAALDGLSVIRTSLAETELDASGTGRTYQGLSQVERAFRRLKRVDRKGRPVCHRTDERVRAHLLPCRLAWYGEWHRRKRLAPLLFDDEEPAAAEAARSSGVAPARVSASAQRKAASKRTDDGRPGHSFRTLLRDLAPLTKNRVMPRLPGAEPFDRLTRPTEWQREAFRLLGVRWQ